MLLLRIAVHICYFSIGLGCIFGGSGCCSGGSSSGCCTSSSSCCPSGPSSGCVGGGAPYAGPPPVICCNGGSSVGGSYGPVPGPLATSGYAVAPPPPPPSIVSKPISTSSYSLPPVNPSIVSQPTVSTGYVPKYAVAPSTFNAPYNRPSRYGGGGYGVNGVSAPCATIQISCGGGGGGVVPVASSISQPVQVVPSAGSIDTDSVTSSIETYRSRPTLINSNLDNKKLQEQIDFPIQNEQRTVPIVNPPPLNPPLPVTSDQTDFPTAEERKEVYRYVNSLKNGSDEDIDFPTPTESRTKSTYKMSAARRQRLMYLYKKFFNKYRSKKTV